MSPKRTTPKTVPSTATLITEPSLFSLSLCLLTVSSGTRSLDETKSPQETCKTEISKEQSSVLCGFREVGVAIEVRIVNSDLVELLGFITCVETGLNQVAKLPVRSCACPALLGRESSTTL